MTTTLESLWHNHHAQLYTHLFLTVRDKSVAEDLLSIVYLRAVSAYANGHGSTQHERGWIWTIARNVLIDHWRAMHRVKWVDIEALAETPAPDEPLDELVQRAQTAETVLRAIDQLPPMQSIVAECRLTGYSYAELAMMLDKSYEAVKILQRRAEAGLRERLQEAI